MKEVAQRPLRPLVLVVSFFGWHLIHPATTQAGFETRNDEIVEVMMETQGADLDFLTRQFSLSQDTTLSFTSPTDIAGYRFSYSTVPGSTYEGQPLSIISSGYFDASDERWHLTSTITVGNMQGTSIGVGQVIGDPMIHIDWGLDDWNTDYHARVTVTHEVIKSAAYVVSRGLNEETRRGFFGDIVTGRSISSDFYETDGPNKGKWIWDGALEAVKISSSGFSPIEGGSGTFTANLRVLPAPSGLVLMGLGSLGLLARALGRRRSG